MRTLFSRRTNFKWENMHSTDTWVLGKQLITCKTGWTMRGYLEIISHTLGCLNRPSRSTSVNASENALISAVAAGEVDDSAAAECREFKYSSKSDVGAGSVEDTFTTSCESSSAFAPPSACARLCMRKKRAWRVLFARVCSSLLKNILDRASTYKKQKTYLGNWFVAFLLDSLYTIIFVLNTQDSKHSPCYVHMQTAKTITRQAFYVFKSFQDYTKLWLN